MSVALREKVLKNGRRAFYLDIYVKGKRSYEFLDLYLTKDRIANKETKELAANIRAKREMEIQTQGYGLAPAFKRKTNFVDYFQKVFEDKKRDEGLRGVDNYTGTKTHLIAYTKGQTMQIGAIDEAWLEGFKAYLCTNVQPNTANNYYARVKAVLNRAVKEGFIQRNPGHNVKYYPTPETERHFLTSEEVSKLAATPCTHPDAKRAFLFCCYTGMRFSDVKALTWGEIKEGRIHFRQKKTGGQEYLPLGEVPLKILAQGRAGKELPLPEKPVFNIPDKGHINAPIRAWVKASGITKKITFHCSRHTFATSLLTAGADLYTTSKLLGHKSISTTAIYAKIVDEKKQAAVDSLPGIEVAA